MYGGRAGGRFAAVRCAKPLTRHALRAPGGGMCGDRPGDYGAAACALPPSPLIPTPSAYFRGSLAREVRAGWGEGRGWGGGPGAECGGTRSRDGIGAALGRVSVGWQLPGRGCGAGGGGEWPGDGPEPGAGRARRLSGASPLVRKGLPRADGPPAAFCGHIGFRRPILSPWMACKIDLAPGEVLGRRMS